jgi:hypothetical protein
MCETLLALIGQTQGIMQHIDIKVIIYIFAAFPPSFSHPHISFPLAYAALHT